MKHGTNLGRYTLIAAVVLAVVAQTGFAAGDEEGFKPLFDGKTSEGWRSFKGEAFPKQGWTIVDGTIHVIAGGGGGDIITTEQFTDFDFRFEWKVSEGANSGVFYRVTEEKDRPYETGPEYQILDNAKHNDGRKAITSAASNYALYPPSEDKTKPVGEWNQGRIVQKGQHVEHWLNGTKVVEFEIGSKDWNDRIEGSKFEKWELFGTRHKGHIGLQDHGNNVWYRNLRIEELSE